MLNIRATMANGEKANLKKKWFSKSQNGHFEQN